MNAQLKGAPVQGFQLCVTEEGQMANRVCPEDAERAEIGRQIVFNARILDSFNVKGFQPLHYDLMVLCAAVEFADRRWKRPQGWSRTLNVIIPVIDFESWHKPEVLQSLQAMLGHLTNDNWKFTFIRAENRSPIGWRQAPLDFSQSKSFAVAYSDGLDSQAVTALSGSKEEALCIRVSRRRQRRNKGDSYFTHIPFKVEGHRSNESSFRSRGFQFAAVTAIAAQLARVTRIVVPESGQGALGPVLLPLYKVYADYRNHPTFFRKMERFIEALLGHRVQFEQPRLWATKGQTLSAFLSLPGKAQGDLASTRSCWQTRRVVNMRGRKQCGLCAACLLRRLSLYAAGVEEAPGTYVVSDLSNRDVNMALAAISRKADRDMMIEYGSVGVRHLQHLADMASLSDEFLRAHVSEIAASTGMAYEVTMKNLRTMLSAHAEEWREFLTAQGEESFLRSWMDGGRYG